MLDISAGRSTKPICNNWATIVLRKEKIADTGLHGKDRLCSKGW
jgi:hypothetical protein